MFNLDALVLGKGKLEIWGSVLSGGLGDGSLPLVGVWGTPAKAKAFLLLNALNFGVSEIQCCYHSIHDVKSSSSSLSK